MFEEMTAKDQSALFENKSKWAFIYQRMKYNRTFNKLKSNIEAVKHEKDQPYHQQRIESLDKYFAQKQQRRQEAMERSISMIEQGLTKDKSGSKIKMRKQITKVPTN